jgi:diguanylate cyclase (GGDEF)-like protein/PAS domain S-box-containing protein
VTRTSRLEPAALDVVLHSILANSPNAPVSAINATWFFVPMPLSVPLTGQQVIQGHATALELVVREDMSIVIETWVQARHHGAAQAAVHLASNPRQPVVLHYVDVMHRHGVYIGLFEIESTADLQSAFRNTPVLRPKVALLQKNEMAVFVQVDDAISQILGWTRDELVGRRSLDLIDPEDQSRAIENWMDMLREPGSRRRVRLRHRHRDGSWVWFEVTNHNLLNDPAHGYVLTEMVDTSEEMAAQESLRTRENLLRRLTDALPLGIFQIDTERQIVYRNTHLGSMLGTPNATSVDKQLSGVVPGDRRQLKRAVEAVLLTGSDRDLELGLLPRARGARRRCTLALRALTDDAGVVTGAIGCLADVTESVRMRDELHDRATFDELTRCLNRAAILRVLEQTLAEQSGDGSGTGAIFIDLDRFKEINDGFGHAAGDAFLVEVARQLASSVREVDVVGRLGGDEFLVVCARVESAHMALRIAERIADAFATAEVLLGAHIQPLSASMGVAWTDRAGAGADELVARADLAMYASKRQGLGRPVEAPSATTPSGRNSPGR